MPTAKGPVVCRRSQVSVLIGPLACIGNAVKVKGSRSSHRGIAVARNHPQRGGGSECVAQVRRPGVIVEFIHLEGVVALEGVKPTVIIEPFPGSAKLSQVAEGGEGARIPLVKERRKGGAAPRST